MRFDRVLMATRLRAKGWNTAQIAVKIGVSRSTVQDYLTDPHGLKKAHRDERRDRAA